VIETLGYTDPSGMMSVTDELETVLVTSFHHHHHLHGLGFSKACSGFKISF
jgi:hypothetical protein